MRGAASRARLQAPPNPAGRYAQRRRPCARPLRGIVHISVVKGGWFIGANGGWGTLIFHGRRYPLSVGDVDAGLFFGLSQTTLVGRVINIRTQSDVAGVYVAAGAGAAVGIGARLIQLANDKGAVLQLEGRQIDLIANLDLSGLAIALR